MDYATDTKFILDRSHAFDTEYHMSQPGLAAPPLVCGSYAHGDQVRFLRKEDCFETLRALLASDAVLVGAFIVTDLAVVAAYAQATGKPDLVDLIFKAFEEDRIYDVLLAESLLDLQEGNCGWDPEAGKEIYRYNLALVAKRYTGEELDKSDNTWRKRYALLDGVPYEEWPSEAIEYPKRDAEVPLLIMAGQIARDRRLRMKNEQHISNLNNLGAQLRAQWCYHLSMIWGMRTDPVVVAKFEHDVKESYDRFMDRFSRLGLYEFNPKKQKWTQNAKRLAALVSEAFQAKGVAAPLTAKNRIRTDKDARIDSGSEDLRVYTEDSVVLKEASTFVKLLKMGTEAPINPEIDILKVTGRVSYSKPNLQQIPNKPIIRQAFIPEEGNVLITADYSAIEMATLAQNKLLLFGKCPLAKAINDDFDVHIMLGAQFLNISYGEFKEKYDSGDPFFDAIRALAKIGNFGLPGGMGAFKLVKSARARGFRFCLAARAAEGCSVERVENWAKETVCKACLDISTKLRALFIQQWAMQSYFDWVLKQTKNGEGGDILTPFSNRLRGQCGFSDGANNPFQSLAADGAKRALWYVTKECYTNRRSILWGSRVLLGVHDQFLLSTPKDRAPWAGDRLAYLMRKGMQEYVPNVKIKCEPALMNYWSKSAKTVRDADGLLTVWTPKEKKAA